MSESPCSDFSPAKFLTSLAHADEAPPTTTNLVILNQPIPHFGLFQRLWSNTSYRLCADGGANRLFDLFQGGLVGWRDQYLPDSIHGDLDSLRDDVREYYEAHGVEVSKLVDQYCTDFAKTMQKVRSMASSEDHQDVVILCTLGGRVDQGLGLLHELLREGTQHPGLRLTLFSDSSVSFVLHSKSNRIQGLQESKSFTENVGIVPVYGPATISLQGFEWDVRDWPTRMGGQVSTSNHIRQDVVSVVTDVPVLFTVEMVPIEPIGKEMRNEDCVRKQSLI